LALNNTLPLYKASKANNQHVPNAQQEDFKVLLNHDINGFSEFNTWNSEAHLISIFSHLKFLEIDSKNMFTSLL